MNLHKLKAHFLFTLKESFRQPGYIIPTLIFPAMFFIFFAAPEAKTMDIANRLVASFSAFAVIGVVFFQFLISSANERHHPWNRYLQILPVSKWTVFIGRAFVSLILAVLAAGIVMGVASYLTPYHLSMEQTAQLIGILVLGSLPFALAGFLIGMWVNPKGASALGNLIYLSATYIGGLWYPPELLPQKVQDISTFLTSRIYGELLWDSVLQKAPRVELWMDLSVHTSIILCLLVFSFWAKKRMVGLET